MKEETLKEVMKYLAPQMRFLTSLMVSHNFTELNLVKKRIEEGLKTGYVKFYPEEKELDINLKDLEKEKGKEWVNLLEKQLKIIIELITKFLQT